MNIYDIQMITYDIRMGIDDILLRVHDMLLVYLKQLQSLPLSVYFLVLASLFSVCRNPYPIYSLGAEITNTS
jgi:hypothetical protein